MIQSILSNIALLLIMHLSNQRLYFEKLKNDLSDSFTRFFHISLTSLAIIAMFYVPIFIGEYRFDLRTIPITYVALLHGPPFAIPILAITSIWRFMMGGPGALPGIVFGLALPTLLALIHYSLQKHNITNLKFFFLYSLFWIISDLPIIFLVPNGLEAFKDIAVPRFLSFQIGAYILHYFVQSSRHQHQLVEQLKTYADRDPLTGLYNMRKFAEIISELRSKTPLYIAMLDLDFFKKINDTYGHRCGDKVLKEVAEILQNADPKKIVAGRYGGEEFILSIASSNKNDAMEIVEAIRHQMEEHHFYSLDGQLINTITISAGIAPLKEHWGIEAAIELADYYLYIAKETGRNRVVADL